MGIDEYDSPEWPDLQNPSNDAATIKDLLETIYGFKTEILHDPTQDKLQDTLLKYGDMEYNEKDHLFIFIAAHGDYESRFGDGFIVTKDSKSTKNDSARDSYSQFSKLRNIIDAIKCEHIAVVLDVCFGGNFGELSRGVSACREVSANEMNKPVDEMYGDVKDNEFKERKMQGKTRQYLALGLTNVPDGTQEHSPFATRIIEALRSLEGKDETLTMTQLYNSVEKNFTQPIFSRFGTDDSCGDFLFIANPSKN